MLAVRPGWGGRVRVDLEDLQWPIAIALVAIARAVLNYKGYSIPLCMAPEGMRLGCGDVPHREYGWEWSVVRLQLTSSVLQGEHCANS
jgi:hypothetical protein